MRIIAGKHKGATLDFPREKITRPLKDRARESIFNLLTHSNKISFQFENSNILDLYAGTGSFGLECLSRKANSVWFVEKSEEAKKVLEKNIKKLKIKKKAFIFFEDVFYLIKKNNFKERFDLIFCDPPFKESSINKLIQQIWNIHLLQKEGILVLHRKTNTKEKFPDCFNVIDERIYGISKITFGKFSS